MWNSMRSVGLSIFCTRLVIALVLVCAVLLPQIIKGYIAFYQIPPPTEPLTTLMVILYSCCIPAMIALFSLDRLLVNIKKERVFIAKNVRLLRLISWCCFTAAAILACALPYYLFSIVMAIVLAFIGLLVRVVKNVIDAAVILKDEHDYTI